MVCTAIVVAPLIHAGAQFQCLWVSTLLAPFPGGKVGTLDSFYHNHHQQHFGTVETTFRRPLSQTDIPHFSVPLHHSALHDYTVIAFTTDFTLGMMRAATLGDEGNLVGEGAHDFLCFC